MTRTFILTSLIILAITTKAQAQCGGCAPSVRSGYTPGSPMTIYLDPTLSQSELSAANGAVTGWNAWFTQQGYAAPYTFTTNPFAANITIAEDPSLHNSGLGGSTTNGAITTNPDYQNRTDGFLPEVVSHEIGHAIGFTDVGGNCLGQTVMFGNISVGGPYTTGPTGTDTCELSQYNPPPSNSTDPTLNQCDLEWGCAEPIVFNLGGGDYRLTGLEDSVAFDIFGVGPRGGKPQIGWTERGASIAFLAFDRNGNGTIDNGGELFGNGTLLKNGAHAANGFDALAQFDSNGDGAIDAEDTVWQYLLLWTDLDHDGVSQPSELQRISFSAITGIRLEHQWTHRQDPSGNYFGYQGTFLEGQQHHLFYDVYFVIAH